jgi:hypothetical protein
MNDPRRMPSLVIPFTALGLGVGWLWVGLLASPVVHAVPADKELPAAVVAGLAAALVGVVAGRRCGPEAARVAPWRTRLRYAFLVLVGGLGAGLFARPTAAGAIAGVAGAALFLPLGAMVLGASRRAARARLGSIVAGADARAPVAILLATAAVASVVAAPDWSAVMEGSAGEAPFALHVARAAAAGVLVLILADVLAWRRLARARAAAATMAACSCGDALQDPRVPRVDLGLGRAIRARLARGAAAYRSRDRAVELIVGSHLRARAAVVRAIGRDVFALAVVGAALAVHGVLGGPRGAVALRDLLCDAGDRWQCGAAILERGCEAGRGADCRVLAAGLDAYDSPAFAPGRAIQLRVRACALGDQASCGDLPAPDLLDAVDACMRGSRDGCARATASFEEAGDLLRAHAFLQRGTSASKL